MLPARVPPVPIPVEKVEYTVILPKVEVKTFSDDPVLQSVRRAHMMRLAKTGKFTPQELREADKIFSLVA
jgi:hypothetical protein